MNWKRESITVVLEESGTGVKMDGIRKGSVGIIAMDAGKVSVTHLATGFRVGPLLPSLGVALEFAEKVEPLLASVHKPKDITAETSRAIYAAINELE